MRIVIIFLAFLFFSIYSYAQSWQELMDSTNLYQEKQDFKTALQWAEKSAAQAKKEFGEKDTNYVYSLSRTYLLIFNIGKVEKAIEYCEKLKPLIKEVRGEQSQEYADIIGNLGEFYKIKGNYERAEQLITEALKMKRHLLKVDHPDLAVSIESMARFYNAWGRYAEAEPLYKEALEMNKRLFKGDHPDLAMSISNIGYFYNGRGRYAEAEPLYKEALEMRRRLFIKRDHTDLAMSINNMASFYNGRGRYAEAEPLYIEALEMYRRLLKGDNPDLEKSINNMAWFYDGRGRYEDAEPLYKEALEMSRRLYKGDHPDLAKSINNMAMFYNGRGLFSEAEPLYLEALGIYRRVFKGDHPNLASSISSLASFYNGMGRYAEAEPLYKEALEMRRRLFKESHPELARSIGNMALFYKNTGRYEEAEPLYLELISSSTNLMNNYFPSLSEKEKEQYYNNFSKFFLQFNNFVVLRYKKSPRLLETMFDNQLLTKSMLLSASNKVRSRILSSNDTNLIKLFTNWKDKKEYISKIYQFSNTQIEKQKINLDSLIKSANEQEKELTKHSEVFRNEYDKQKLTWKDVQNSLGKDDAAVEIVRFRYYEKNQRTDSVYYAVLVVKKNSEHPELVLLKNGNDLDSKYINNYKRIILNQLEDKDSYTQFWEQISKNLKGIKEVYISPDGVYNQINISTLMNPMTEHYLSDDIDIRVVTSTRDLVEKKMDSRFRGNDSLPPVVELFGDPLFNLDSTKHLELASAISENRTREFYYLGNTLDSSTRGGIRPLPSTRQEIEQIANEFTKNGWKVNSHLGEKALEESVKGVNNPIVLHIATHGKFLKDVEVKDDDRMLGMETKRVAENPLLRSFLLFSGAENTLNNQKLENQNTDDGLLTAYEAMNLNLDNTDLVVLSACETGLGEIKNGEGVYGLQRAFQQAGAKSIIMSLWSVPDKETKELMTSFYSKWLTGKDKRTAFNEARNEMRDKYHYPYYWGGFVMVGE